MAKCCWGALQRGGRIEGEAGAPAVMWRAWLKVLVRRYRAACACKILFASSSGREGAWKSAILPLNVAESYPSKSPKVKRDIVGIDFAFRPEGKCVAVK